MDLRPKWTVTPGNEGEMSAAKHVSKINEGPRRKKMMSPRQTGAPPKAVDSVGWTSIDPRNHNAGLLYGCAHPSQKFQNCPCQQWSRKTLFCRSRFSAPRERGQDEEGGTRGNGQAVAVGIAHSGTFSNRRQQQQHLPQNPAFTPPIGISILHSNHSPVQNLGSSRQHQASSSRFPRRPAPRPPSSSEEIHRPCQSPSSP